MLKERVDARLAETERKCDGCGTHIGRFTSKCYFDEAAGLAYCSTGGCADKIRSAPPCAGCGGVVNPFTGKVVEDVAVTLFYCAQCADSPREGGNNDGPYQVRTVRPGWYQVVRPMPDGGVFVRSALACEERAKQLRDLYNGG